MTTFSPTFPEGMQTKPTGNVLRMITNRMGNRRGITGLIADEVAKALGGTSTHNYTRIAHSTEGGVRQVEDYTADENNGGVWLDTAALAKAFSVTPVRPVMRDLSGNGAGSRW